MTTPQTNLSATEALKLARDKGGCARPAMWKDLITRHVAYEKDTFVQKERGFFGYRDVGGRAFMMDIAWMVEPWEWHPTSDTL